MKPALPLGFLCLLLLAPPVRAGELEDLDSQYRAMEGHRETIRLRYLQVLSERAEDASPEGRKRLSEEMARLNRDQRALKEEVAKVVLRRLEVEIERRIAGDKIRTVESAYADIGLQEAVYWVTVELRELHRRPGDVEHPVPEALLETMTQERMAYLRTLRATMATADVGDEVALAQARAKERFARLRESYDDLRSRRAALSESVSDDDPAREEIESEIEHVSERIAVLQRALELAKRALRPTTSDEPGDALRRAKEFLELAEWAGAREEDTTERSFPTGHGAVEAALLALHARMAQIGLDLEMERKELLASRGPDAPDVIALWKRIARVHDVLDRLSHAGRLFDRARRAFLEARADRGEVLAKEATETFRAVQDEVVTEPIESTRSSAGTGAPGGQVTLLFTKAPIRMVLMTIARHADASFLWPAELAGEVTAHFEAVPWRTALDSVLASIQWAALEASPAHGDSPAVLRMVPLDDEGRALLLYDVKDLRQQAAEDYAALPMPPGAKAKSLGTTLEVRATPAEHDALARALADIRRKLSMPAGAWPEAPAEGAVAEVAPPGAAGLGAAGSEAPRAGSGEGLEGRIDALHEEVRALRREVAEIKRLLEGR